MSGNAIYLSKGGGFVSAAEKIAEKIHRVNKNLTMTYAEILAEEKEKISAPTREEMSLDEYKNFIAEKLQALPHHPSTFKDDNTVIISDAAFESMKKNPEYEDWVIDRVAQNLSTPDFLCFYPGNNGRTATFQFGETEEDYRGTMQGKPSKNFPNNEESYWQLRLDRLKKRLAAEQEYFLDRQRLEKVSETLAERRAIAAKMSGLDDTIKPELPITGVPAELLLALL